MELRTGTAKLSVVQQQIAFIGLFLEQEVAVFIIRCICDILIQNYICHCVYASTILIEKITQLAEKINLKKCGLSWKVFLKHKAPVLSSKDADQTEINVKLFIS